MRRMICPSEESLNVFRKDLWKDQRRLERVQHNGSTYLVKHYVSEHEALHEKSVLNFLVDRLQRAKVPEVVEHGPLFARLPYLSGIRVFNLLVELDRMHPPLDYVAGEAKKHILLKCEENQKEIQHALIAWSNGRELLPYPVEKMTTLINLLADCCGIEIESTVLNEECVQLCEILKAGSSVPFRDATTKNMVLASPSLWLGNFKGEDERCMYLRHTLASKSRPDWLDAPIYDFDFASCINRTTPEDDLISLRFHERTWQGMPENEEELVWFGSSDARRAAATFFMRYYRFGGRKAAYRLLHPSGSRIRFRHDSDVFYFERAASIMEHLWADSKSEFSALIAFTNIAAKILQIPVSPFDFFRAQQDRNAARRQYYVDMYPE